jgi:hypothetical protein
MAKRGGKGGVRFEIDEAGIPHAFCLSKFSLFFSCLRGLFVEVRPRGILLTYTDHSQEIADKVAPWVGEMVLGVKAK